MILLSLEPFGNCLDLFAIVFVSCFCPPYFPTHLRLPKALDAGIVLKQGHSTESNAYSLMTGFWKVGAEPAQPSAPKRRGALDAGMPTSRDDTGLYEPWSKFLEEILVAL